MPRDPVKKIGAKKEEEGGEKMLSGTDHVSRWHFFFITKAIFL